VSLEKKNGDDDENLVLFKTSTTNQHLTDKRIKVHVHIPEKTKKYFLPDSEWKTTLKEIDEMLFFPVEKLSYESNAFYTKPYPYTESQLYQAPFFIIFKAGKLGHPNFLQFVDFLKPNSESCILSMLNYHTDDDVLYSKFSLGIQLKASDVLTLNNVLEFILVDSNKIPVNIENKSQLFISIKIMELIP